MRFIPAKIDFCLVFWLLASDFRSFNGGVAEWFKAHAWKVCIRQNRIGGSNPPSSANNNDATALCGFYCA